MRYRNIILRQVQRVNSLHGMISRIILILKKGKRKLIKDVLEEAEIDHGDSLVFSALVYLQNQNLAEITGGIPTDQRFTTEVICLTEKGMLQVGGYSKKNNQEEVYGAW